MYNNNPTKAVLTPDRADTRRINKKKAVERQLVYLKNNPEAKRKHHPNP